MAPLRPLAIPLLLAFIPGCAPKIPPGPVPVDEAARPVIARVVPMAGRAVEVELLAGGSRWDPPGQAGRAALAIDVIAAADEATWGVIGQDRAWVGRSCQVGEPPGACANKLVLALVGPFDPAAVEAARARRLQRLRRWPDDPDRAETLVGLGWERLAWGSHPYGRSGEGRTSTVERLQADALSHWSATHIRRATLDARASDALLAGAFTQALAALPGGLAPDAAMKGPPDPRGPVIAWVPVAGPHAWLFLGATFPRPATEATRLHPGPDALADMNLANRCLRDALAGSGTIPGPIGPVPPATAHGAVQLRVGPLPPAELERIEASLPETVEGLLQSMPDRCRPVQTLLSKALEPHRQVWVTGWPTDIEDPAPPYVSRDAFRIVPEELLR